MSDSFTKAIGILGGTFDPVHYGHLRTALELYQAFNLAEVRWVPCYQPVHRKPPVASADERLKMVRCAIENTPAFTLDDYEIQQKKPSYTIDTLEALQQKLPNTTLCLILGIDALLGFSSWHRYEDILQYAHLIVAHRPQYQLPQNGKIAELLKARLQQGPAAIYKKTAGHIFLHPVTALEISATDIRKQIGLGQDPRYLLPDAVYHYIEEHGVYSINHI